MTATGISPREHHERRALEQRAEREAKAVYRPQIGRFLALLDTLQP